MPLLSVVVSYRVADILIVMSVMWCYCCPSACGGADFWTGRRLRTTSDVDVCKLQDQAGVHGVYQASERWEKTPVHTGALDGIVRTPLRRDATRRDTQPSQEPVAWRDWVTWVTSSQAAPIALHTDVFDLRILMRSASEYQPVTHCVWVPPLPWLSGSFRLLNFVCCLYLISFRLQDWM